MSSSGNYGFRYLNFYGEVVFYEINGFYYNKAFESSKICGKYRFENQNKLLYMKWDKCNESSAGTKGQKSDLLNSSMSTPDIYKTMDDKVYKVIHLVRKKTEKKSPYISYKEALSLIECPKATWDTPVEEIVKILNRSEFGKMNIKTYVRQDMGD